MKDYREQLLMQLRAVSKLEGAARERLEKNENTENVKVWASSVGGYHRYYMIDAEERRIYAGKKDLDKVKRIVQNEYDTDAYNKLVALRKRIEKALKLNNISEIKDLYEKLPAGKKALVTPILMTDEDYVNKWRKENPENSDFLPGEKRFRTERGEYVRSKSEKILADMFYGFNIPYAYEPKFKMWDGREVSPDFVLLNMRTRKTWYWEHFGKVSEAEYAKKNFSKIYDYELSGLEYGVDFLYSMESKEMPLDISVQERKVKDYLL